MPPVKGCEVLKRGSGEGPVKAALLESLRVGGGIDPRRSVVISELAVLGHGRRADLVILKGDSHCIEIKTNRDSLARLDDQLAAYSSVFDRVSVVCGAKHANAVLSRVQPHVGVIEILEFGERMEFVTHKEPGRSPSLDAAAIIASMPVVFLRALGSSGARARRDDLALEATALPLDRVSASFKAYLKERYRPTSRAFFANTRRRHIKADDLNTLRAWASETSNSPLQQVVPTRDTDWETFRSIGASFGPVPDDILASFLQEP